jgi:hypothetical protein
VSSVTLGEECPEFILMYIGLYGDESGEVARRDVIAQGITEGYMPDTKNSTRLPA